MDQNKGANGTVPPAANPSMSDEKRQKLAEILDSQLEDELEKLENSGSKYMDGWSEENWEEEMANHPFFANQQSLQNQEELSPLMKGLQDLKYSPDENTPSELAANYKEDGNFNFKCKKYRMAVIAYTEGIRNLLIAISDLEQKTTNGEMQEKQEVDDEAHKLEILKAQLITNRAAAQFRLGNCRSSLIDCRLALKEQPTHMKAIERAIECCIRLSRHEECIQWCDQGLEVLNGQDKAEQLPADEEKKKSLQSKRASAEKTRREVERNRRKEEMIAKKAKMEEDRLLHAIRSRNIIIQKSHKNENVELSMCDLEPCHPAALKKKVHFVKIPDHDKDARGNSNNEDDMLAWPVLFLYPEYGESDFIEEFTECDTILDHMNVMFDNDSPPPWDTEAKYRCPDAINVYYEDATTNPARPKLIHIQVGNSLVETISKDQGHPGLIAGTPVFILLARNSPFEKEFLKKYNL